MKKPIKNKLYALIIIFSVSLANFSCQKSSNEDLKDVQMCLNKASNSEALSCVSKISSNTSAQAYALRCAAYFISENLGDPSTIISALSSATNGSSTCSGCSSTLNTLSSLTFSSSTVATEAFNNCLQSGVSSYVQIGSLTQIASSISGIASMTPDQIKSAVNTLDPADLGSIVSQTYTASCSGVSTTGTDALSQYCNEISAAASGLTNQQIGYCTQYALTGYNVQDSNTTKPTYCP